MKKEQLASELVDAIRGQSTTQAYDTQATVTRVDGDTVWVHIPGGVDETPVQKTISAKTGDTVQVRVGGGDAWLVGNATSPPTDDSTAIIATDNANVAKETAVNAQETADEALEKVIEADRLIATKADIDLLNVSGSVIANRIDATTLMAKNLTATGKFEVNNGSYKLEQSASGGLSIRTGNATPSTGSEFYLTDSDIGMRIDDTHFYFKKNTTTQAIRAVLEANDFEIGGNTLIDGNLTTSGTAPGSTSNNIGDGTDPWNTLYVNNINLNGTTYSKLSSSSVPWSNYASNVSNKITLTSNNVAAGPNSVTIYVRFTAGSISSGATLWTVASEYAPVINYPILSVRSVTAPYLEVGTVWLNTSGTATLYGTLTNGTGYYVTGTYTI